MIIFPVQLRGFGAESWSCSFLHIFRDGHAHPHRLEVGLLHVVRGAAELDVEPLEQVENRLGGRDDVERRRNGPALLEIRDPQFTAGKFPLGVSFFLKVERGINMKPYLAY